MNITIQQLYDAMLDNYFCINERLYSSEDVEFDKENEVINVSTPVTNENINYQFNAIGDQANIFRVSVVTLKGDIEFVTFFRQVYTHEVI